MITTDRTIPIQTLHLFPILDRMLLDLLVSLSDDDWNAPTIAKLWTVKDIVAHLLDGNLKGLSTSRDHYKATPNQHIHYYADLVSYINSQNHQWTDASRRLSPRLLMELLEFTGRRYADHLFSLDPWEQAIYGVAWAGQENSANWFHIAREYTEKFLHQQQIRDAVNKPGLITKELFYPFIDTLMQGLPYTYSTVDAGPGTAVSVIVSGEVGGQWDIKKYEKEWILTSLQEEQSADATITIDPDLAWKLFSKSKSYDEVLGEVNCQGNEALGLAALRMVSVMA